jgi:hypothetical protein
MEVSMAEAKDALAVAKERLAKEKEAADKSTAEASEQLSKGKPTPTQEENDLAKLGAALDEHEDDGSGPSPTYHTVRTVEADKPAGGYQTRQATPARPAPPRPAGTS